MTPLTLLLSDELKAFAEGQVAARGLRGVNDYVSLLLQEAQANAAAAKFAAAMRQGLAGDPGLSLAAQADVERHLARYATQPAIAARFSAAVAAADVASGEQRETAAPDLAGLVACPVKGFADIHVYGIPGPDGFRILRVLHRTRDLAA